MLLMKKQKKQIKSIEIGNTKVENKIVPERQGRLMYLIQSYPIVVWFVLATLGCLWVFFPFLFEEKIMLYGGIGSDSVTQMYPMGQMLVSELKDGFPTWSFQQGLGQFVASFNIGNPFIWIHYVMGGSHNAFAWVECIKYLSSGLFFALFLRNHAYDALAIIIGALAYTFNAYILVTSGWAIFFSTWAFTLSFLLFALSVFFTKKNPWFIPIAILLICGDQPVNLLLFAEVGLVYAVIYAYLHKDTFKPIKNFGTLLLVAIVGLLISSYFIYINMYGVLMSPRGAGIVNNFNDLKLESKFQLIPSNLLQTTLIRLFSNNLNGVADNFKGWNNYMEAPALYIGIFSLLLFPQLFFLANKERRNVFIASAVLCIVVLLFPYVRYLLWGATGDYFRIISLFISLCILMGALTSLQLIYANKKMNLPALIVSFITCLLLLFATKTETTLEEEFTKVVMFIFILFGTLLLVHFSKSIRWLYLLLAVTFIEMSLHARASLSGRDELNEEAFASHIGYNDNTREALDYIRHLDSSIYRIEKNYGSAPCKFISMNDAMVQHFMGTRAYTSFNHKNQVLYMAAVGALDLKNELETRWLNGISTRPFLMGNVSVKYYLSKTLIPHSSIGFDSLTKFGDVIVYKNKYALPLGASFTKHIPRKQFDNYAQFTKEIQLYRGLVLEENDLKAGGNLVAIEDTISQVNLTFLDTLCMESAQGALQIKKWESSRIEGISEATWDRLIYFSFPFDMGWHAQVDGHETTLLKANAGLTALPLKAGKHQVILYYNLPYMQLTVWVTLLGVILVCLLAFYTYIKAIKNK
jgi:uncharacterized membrane protein YfhO